ncbi:hypothetical protein ILYODFUR_002253 [Ilyodon furcidens]|uniref:Uncharacterized protein n=1 Tax=Ilyodon furcidens TaxID=33524 RepID=A0ABV0TR79_9TELE
MLWSGGTKIRLFYGNNLWSVPGSASRWRQRTTKRSIPRGDALLPSSSSSSSSQWMNKWRNHESPPAKPSSLS